MERVRVFPRRIKKEENVVNGIGKMFASLGDFCHQISNFIGMTDASLSRLADAVGISLEIPEEPGEEITDRMRAEIIDTRNNVDLDEWLRKGGPRDQLCVRFGIARQQIRGVLGGQSRNGDDEVAPSPKKTEVKVHKGGNGKKAKKSGSSSKRKPNGNDELFEASKLVDPIDASNPDSWPKRRRKSGGATPHPEQGATEYAVDGTDLALAMAVLKHDPDSWPQVRLSISRIRRLTTQQTAWLKAHITARDLLDK